MFEKHLEDNAEKGMFGFVILGPIFGLLYVVLLPLIGILTLLMALPQYASANKTPLSENSGVCLSCHATKGMTKVFGNNEKMSVFVNATELVRSVHSALDCSDCHQQISLTAHPGQAFDSRRAFALDAAASCSICHPDDQLMTKPNHTFIANRTNAPPCTQCHGAHAVKRVADWKPSLAVNQYCLTCHSQNISKTHRNGEKLSLQIDQTQLRASVHSKHACNDCHAEFSRSSHPVKTFGSSREHSIAISDACKKCHEDKATSLKDSIHYKGHFVWGESLVRGANMKTPVCTDCHGFHAVGPQAMYETMSGVPCRKCHENIFTVYSKSVHGMARERGEHKAPLCSSCHFAHEVKATAMAERIRTACLGCHSGAEDAHDKWLPNAGLHLSMVACASCHSPNAGKGIYLRLYDQNTGKPFTEEQVVSLLGTSREGLLQKMDFHGDGIDSYELWNIVNQLNAKGTDARVTFLGKMDLNNASEAHMLSVKKNAVRECESCHQADSAFFKTVTVAIIKADGDMSRFTVKPEVLGSMISLASLRQFYTLGSTRLKFLDWIGMFMVFGGISVPLLHATVRILTLPMREAKRLNRMRKEERR